MEFDQFIKRVASLLRVEFPEPVNPYDSLYEDLGIGSIQAFELLIIVESLAESMVPPAEIPQLFTIGDAYDYYQQLVADVTET